MIVQQMNVTPEIAREWLTKNEGNRRLRAGNVNHLAGAIERGEWKMNHQPIAIDASGNILDGQHRLSAVVKTGITCPMMVAFGADRATFATIDVGLKRRVEDIYGVSKAAAGVVNAIARSVLSHAYSAAQAGAYIDVFGATADWLERECPTRATRLTTISVRAAVVVRMVHGRAEESLENYRNFSLMQFEKMPPIIQAFARRCLAKRSGQEEQMLLAFRAFEPGADGKRTHIRDLGTAREEFREVVAEVMARPKYIAQAAD